MGTVLLVTTLLLVLAFLMLYFLPSIIAHSRKHPHYGTIVFLNLFTGWTVIGWVGCLVWALVNYDKQQPQVIYMPSPPIKTVHQLGYEAVEHEIEEILRR